MGTKKIICMVVMFFGLCIGAMAQKSIDKVVEDMEKNSDARVTSIKKRDPDTRKVVKVTKTIRLTDAQIAKRALEAFEREEENALTSIKEKRSRIEYTLTYRNKVEKRTYILNIRENNDVEISVFITPASEGDTSWLGNERQLSGMNLAHYDMDKFKEQMAELQQLGNLGELNGLGEKIQKEVKDRLKHNNIELEADEIYVNGKRIVGDTVIEDNQAEDQ